MSSVCFRISLMGCIVLISLLSFTVHAEKFTECKSCHTAEKMDEKHIFEIVDKCATCHTRKENHELEIANLSFKTVSRKTASGLSMPQYYDTSRIGDKPNEMVAIPAGKFIMGTNDRLSDEGPQHVRTLENYYIDIYEVTNLQYKAFIDETGRRSPKHFRNRTYPDGKADHPVTFVSWKDANAYCKWGHKRLPTDAEWEKAARGTQGNIFPWGQAFDIDNANTPQRWKVIDKDGDTTPVGAFPKGVSEYGLHDTSGNVWEWTDTWYQAYPGNKRITENYGKKYKTLKGGSWWNCSFYKCGISSPVYNRSFFLRSTKNSTFGFRCASDTSPDGKHRMAALKK